MIAQDRTFVPYRLGVCAIQVRLLCLGRRVPSQIIPFPAQCVQFGCEDGAGVVPACSDQRVSLRLRLDLGTFAWYPRMALTLGCAAKWPDYFYG